jgi:hypothetical protein
MSKNPLDDEFNIATDNMIDDDYVAVHIPDERELKNLDLIADLALKAYKEQMDDIALIEPKNRVKYLEVCERYLNQAKDAIYKKKYLEEMAKRIVKANAGKTGSEVAKDGAGEDEESTAEYKPLSRAELAEKVRLVKK